MLLKLVCDLLSLQVILTFGSNSADQQYSEGKKVRNIRITFTHSGESVPLLGCTIFFYPVSEKKNQKKSNGRGVNEEDKNITETSSLLVAIINYVAGGMLCLTK